MFNGANEKYEVRGDIDFFFPPQSFTGEDIKSVQNLI